MNLLSYFSFSHSCRDKVLDDSSPHNKKQLILNSINKQYSLAFHGELLPLHNSDMHIESKQKGIGARIAEEMAQREIGENELARRTGVNQPTIHRIITGKTNSPRVSTIRPIMEYLFGQDREEVVLLAEMFPQASFKRVITWDSPEDLPDGEYVFVSRSYARLSAGTGEIVFSGEQGPPLAFTTEWVKEQHLYEASLWLMKAVGNSMTPYIYHGDILLVHTRIGDDFQDGEVYAIRYDTELRVKRLYHRYDGAWIIRSDNSERYPEEVIAPDSFEHIDVLGQVVWLARGT